MTGLATILCIAFAAIITSTLGSSSRLLNRGLAYKFDRNATDGNVTVNYMTPHEEVVLGKPISECLRVKEL